MTRTSARSCVTRSATHRVASCTIASVALLLAAACGQPAQTANTTPPAPAATAPLPATPVPVDGWAEYPLREGVIRLQPAAWRTDTIRIPVAGGAELEYKLGMKKGDALVYSIDYGDLEHPGLMISEFHGHTEKRADGVGDLMFYSKDGPPRQHGQFLAPWEGIHGWYLKNESSRDVVVMLKVAGYYELVAK